MRLPPGASMSTHECLARAHRPPAQGEQQVKALDEAETATGDLVRKSRDLFAAARRTIAANPSSRITTNAARTSLEIRGAQEPRRT